MQAAETLVSEAAGSPKNVLVVRGALEAEQTAEDIVRESLKRFGKIDVLVGLLRKYRLTQASHSRMRA